MPRLIVRKVPKKLNTVDDFWARADAIRAMIKPQLTDGTKLLREMRDTR